MRKEILRWRWKNVFCAVYVAVWMVDSDVEGGRHKDVAFRSTSALMHTYSTRTTRSDFAWKRHDRPHTSYSHYFRVVICSSQAVISYSEFLHKMISQLESIANCCIRICGRYQHIIFSETFGKGPTWSTGSTDIARSSSRKVF
ncbi:hypothetical protein BD410DRAFT_205277 [Rickenella mellea]|uniref:Secreted protein n=1 Tax=Rickenella mellea TaxID=50990 RepID=A0A4Y7Q4A9_9AGAM|nr:hypothetical protein BD410DRAFT_205277 [Rickenella mellea]